MNIITYGMGMPIGYQSWDARYPIPADAAIVPDGCDMAVYWEYDGYVAPEIKDGVVVGFIPDVAAFEDYKAALAAAEAAKGPTIKARVSALEDQLAQTDETAIELFEANLAQEEINAAQDEALIELYELIGG